MAFLKQASLKIENPEVTVSNWVGNKGNVKTASNKVVEYKKIIADFDPDKYLLTHCTIVASVDVENAEKPVHFASTKTKEQYKDLENRKDYFITPQTAKYMNANGDAWSRELLKKSYRTFVGAENYVEHVQDPALSKGKILDAVAREVDDNKSIFIDILVATNKKHTELVNKIKTGQLQTLSMGAVVAFTICSQCGRVAADETELCNHIKFLKKNNFISEYDGKKRITAELCGHFLYPESNRFIEGSWVETPAFKGAVLRNEVSVDLVEKLGFEESIAPLLSNLNDKDLAKTASRIINAFQIVDSIKSSFNKKSQTDQDEKPEIEDVKEVDIEEPSPEELENLEVSPEEAPVEETEEAPVEETEEAPVEETEEAPVDEAPVDEAPVEKLPPEMEEMGEPPKEEEEKVLEQESKKPYDVLKNEIKEQLKDQIKKELLKDLGIEIEEVKPTPSNINNVNLNDTLVKSSLNRIRSACIIAKEVGLKNITKHGYTHKDVIKIAELSNKYSINKEVFNAMLSIDSGHFSSVRKFAQNIENKLGRELDAFERIEIDKFVKELLK
jgi:flagellar biosynthesis GTPase FlhF